jgi:hypothetical protein
MDRNDLIHLLNIAHINKHEDVCIRVENVLKELDDLKLDWESYQDTCACSDD